MLNPYFSKTLLLSLLLCPLLLIAQPGNIDLKAKKTGFFNYIPLEDSGKVILEVPKDRGQFLYVNALTVGVGSNDIGLDRGQLGDTRIVEFLKSGNKLLLHQPNLRYRATSDNPAERKAIQESFATSVLWGFEIVQETANHYWIDLTPFLLQDAHGVAGQLKTGKQGNYKLDETRSSVYFPQVKNFPKNTEFEALLTFVGDPEGRYIREVAPTPSAVTVRQHHSFIALPDDDYEPRRFDPRSGYFFIEYADYAAPIGEPLEQRFIARHRLKKKNPNQERSEPVEPIVYYLDPGTPEPVRSALLEGAAWWNQAFEAAGYVDAFQIKMLPDSADMLDVRYNVIQWVHRKTRGWSYGASVIDPRTGEIIKGHVSLGSLRVRQDYLLAQGYLQGYDEDGTPDPRMEALALARLRQLSAHEVGHTLGLSHNFAASYTDRSSVMDYPHPLVQLADGEVDLTNAYAVGIGDWDKRAILYGYQDFPARQDQEQALLEILEQNDRLGLKYISDSDARPAGGAHPHAHLWDNGAPVQELDRTLALRKALLENFNPQQLPPDRFWAELERLLVPIYFSHRYAVEATAKLVGGQDYDYAQLGSTGSSRNLPVVASLQEEALEKLLETLEPKQLMFPEAVIPMIYPRPMGYEEDRELFHSYTDPVFDPLAAAESAAHHSLALLMQPQRLARLVSQHALDSRHMDLNDYFERIMTKIFLAPRTTNYEKEIARTVEKLVVIHLLKVAYAEGQLPQVTATARYVLHNLQAQFKVEMEAATLDPQRAHFYYLGELIRQAATNIETLKLPEPLAMPPGSPIGCGEW